MDKRLLVLGAGIDQIPGFQKARQMGIYTIALDGNPEAKAFDFADESHVVSIKHIEQIEAFIDTYTKKIDGVIAFGVDIPYIIAYVAEKLNVNYTVPLESAKLSEDKFLSKEFMKKNKIKIPEYSKVNSIQNIKEFTQLNGFPFVLKPVDNSASRGISILNNLNDIKKYYDYALENSSSDNIMIEKFLNGPQISSESFIVNGEVYNIGFSDRNYDDMERFLPNIIENGGDLPSLFMKDKHKVQLKKYLQIVSKELNIKNGVIKGDLVIHNDDLYIIEFALRLSGGNFSTIEIPESTGVDFLKIAIKLHLGIKIQKEELVIIKNENICLRYKFLEDTQIGQIKKIINPKFDSVISNTLFVKECDVIKKTKTENHANRLASVITRGNSRDDAILKAQDFLNKLEIIVE